MFDRDLIDGLGGDIGPKVLQAIALIAESGICELQKRRIFTQASSAADQDTDEVLMDKLRIYRRSVRSIDQLQTLGTQINKEQNDAHE